MLVLLESGALHRSSDKKKMCTFNFVMQMFIFG